MAQPTPTPNELYILRIMADGDIAERVWTGRENKWLLNGSSTLHTGGSVTRAIKGLIRKKLVWAHYPHGSASAGINDEGRAAITAAERGAV